MDFNQACRLAADYFAKELDIRGLERATEGAGKWFFSAAGTAGSIGMVIVSVDKDTGRVATVNMLSAEGFGEVRSSTPVDVPEAYLSK